MKVNVWREKVVISTYEIGEPEKNTVFLENRVYQGSSGKVYPHPIIEKISDTKIDKECHTVYLKNNCVKIMILSELGGRVQMAYDKTLDLEDLSTAQKKFEEVLQVDSNHNGAKIHQNLIKNVSFNTI